MRVWRFQKYVLLEDLFHDDKLMAKILFFWCSFLAHTSDINNKEKLGGVGLEKSSSDQFSVTPFYLFIYFLTRINNN